MNTPWSGQDLIATALVAIAAAHLAWRAWRTCLAHSSLSNIGCGGGCQGCPSSNAASAQLVTLRIPSSPGASHEKDGA